MANSTLANTHLLRPTDTSETYTTHHKLLPFRKYLILTHSDTFIHGPFDFALINNLRSRDRICQTALSSDLFSLAQRKLYTPS